VHKNLRQITMIMSNTPNTVFLLICRVTYGRSELKPLKANLTKC